MNRAETISLALDAGFNPKTSEEMDMFVTFARLVQTRFMDHMIAHPEIVRQIIDAGLLSSDPAGLKHRKKQDERTI